MKTQSLDSKEISKLPGLFDIKDEAFDSKTVPQKIEYLKTIPKPRLFSTCFMGHVDAGKSTTVGRLLYDTGTIDPRIIEQYQREAIANKRDSFSFAYVMDKSKDERERGITIECGLGEFVTPNGRYMTIVDAPGHGDFVKNMVVGTNQADLACLLVDAKTGLVKEDITDQHLSIARASGIKSIIVLLNKLNLVPLAQRMKIYHERVKEIDTLLNRCFFKDPARKIFIPVNSFGGWNIADKSFNDTEFPGYEGPSFLEALDQIPIDESVFQTDAPLRMSLENVHTKIAGTKVVGIGKLISGTIVPGMELILKPANKICKVGGIEMHHKKCKYVSTGGSVALSLLNVTKDDFSKGSILSVPHVKDTATNVEQFTMEKCYIRAHPTELSVGSQLIAHFHSGNKSCEVLKIQKWNSPTQTQEVKSIKPGNFARITLKPQHSIVVDPLSIHTKTSKVLLRDCKDTIGYGSITAVKLDRDQIIAKK